MRKKASKIHVRINDKIFENDKASNILFDSISYIIDIVGLEIFLKGENNKPWKLQSNILIKLENYDKQKSTRTYNDEYYFSTHANNTFKINKINQILKYYGIDGIASQIKNLNEDKSYDRTYWEKISNQKSIEKLEIFPSRRFL